LEETWVTPSAKEPGIDFERIVDKDGNTPTHLNQRLFDKHTGRMVQDGLIQQVKMEAGRPTPRAEDSEQTGAHSGEPDTLTSAARYFPTPSAMDGERGPESKETKEARGSGGVNLREAAAWNTPRSRDWKGDGKDCIQRDVKAQWSTPMAQDCEQAGGTGKPLLTKQARGSVGLPDQDNPSTHGSVPACWQTTTADRGMGSGTNGTAAINAAVGTPGQSKNYRGSLNPAWVAQLMIGRGGESWLDGVKPHSKG
jgi:hypothetical protein